MKFKFIDLNVWLGGQIFEPMLNFLKKENADILTLQEVYDENSEILPANFRCLSIIKKELNYPYSSFAPSTLWNNGTFKADIGNAILSRFPIETDNYVFYDRPYGQYTEGVIEDYPNISRTLQYALLNLGKVNLNIFNTQGIWGLDGFDNEKRLKMGSYIAERVKNKGNVILAGDFNMEANTESINRIEKYLINVFKNDNRVTSFNIKRKTNPGYATAVVDMIFVSPDVKTLKHFSPNEDVSDHLPLVCEFEVN